MALTHRFRRGDRKYSREDDTLYLWRSLYEAQQGLDVFGRVGLGCQSMVDPDGCEDDLEEGRPGERHHLPSFGATHS